MIEPSCTMVSGVIKSIDSDEQYIGNKLIQVPGTKISSSRNLWKNLEIVDR
jgi:hypothetical protein